MRCRSSHLPDAGAPVVVATCALGGGSRRYSVHRVTHTNEPRPAFFISFPGAVHSQRLFSKVGPVADVASLVHRPEHDRAGLLVVTRQVGGGEAELLLGDDLLHAELLGEAVEGGEGLLERHL